MKKRLEAELISIAHRVLKLKNKSEVDQLFAETQKLYEALSVLKFYGDHIDYIKPEIPQEELEEKLADSLDSKSTKVKAVSTEKMPEVPVVAAEEESEVTETKVVAETHEPDSEAVKTEIVPADEESEISDPSDSEQAEQTKEVAVDHEEEQVEEPIIVGEINIDEGDDIEEEPAAETKEEVNSDFIFEMAAEAPVEKTEPIKTDPSDSEQAKQTKQISFEDFLGDNYSNVEFVKPNDTSKPVQKTEAREEIKDEPAEVLTENKEEKKTILNEKLATGINIGLNDRVGFVKYLFDNSSEDFNRVLSQLNTFDSYAEAKEFIDDMVKPDYNNWQGNEDFAERFMEIVEQKFK